MMFRGHMKNGVAVLDEPADLPDGTPVHIQVVPSDADFWHGKSIEELAREQGVKPCSDPDALAGDWPEDESLDDFLAAIRRARI